MTQKLLIVQLEKLKLIFRNNIIKFITALIKNDGMSLHDFATAIDSDKQNLDSILSKKRFIELDELIKVSEKFEVSINNIVNG